jgi:hypothetical protein
VPCDLTIGREIFFSGRPSGKRQFSEQNDDDRLETGGGFSQPTQGYLEGLQPPEIVGEVGNPVLEAFRRFWWRAFDRVCYCIVLIRLSIQDCICIYGPEPLPPADLKREADHERLVQAFPTADQTLGRHSVDLRRRWRIPGRCSLRPCHSAARRA